MKYQIHLVLFNDYLIIIMRRCSCCSCWSYWALKSKTFFFVFSISMPHSVHLSWKARKDYFILFSISYFALYFIFYYKKDDWVYSFLYVAFLLIRTVSVCKLDLLLFSYFSFLKPNLTSFINDSKIR